MNRRRRFKAKRARRHARLFRDAMIGVVVAARAAWRRDHPMTKLLAPWTDAQVNALNRWQSLWHAHPFTCPSEQHPGVSLVARHEGWFCPLCDYRQDWAHAEMASGAWPPPFPGNIAEFVKTEVATLGHDLDVAYGEISKLRARNERLEQACVKQNAEICLTLGRALGYPWFKDDRKNFPDATEEHGVCVGDHVAESIAMEAAGRIASQDAEIEELRAAGRGLVALLAVSNDEREALRAEVERLRAAKPIS